MTASVYRLENPKLNVLARKIHDLGVNPPLETIIALLGEAHLDGYEMGKRAGRMEIERRPFERTYGKP